ncbi:hypothetical protein AB0N14_19870 [Streptomyces sp. NPDC051104]|uniref:hypothetical protein n=1 Tax=Streptomyces sp. NPDC051104 TaxID=3155044 RepID=UPI0034179711
MPQFSLTVLSQSVFLGVPEKPVFAKNCRLNTGEVQVVAAEAGVVTVSRPPAVASTTAVAAAAVVRRPAWFIRSSDRTGTRRGVRDHDP